MLLATALAAGPYLDPDDLSIYAKADSCGICTINIDFKIEDALFVPNSYIAAKCEDTNNTMPLAQIDANSDGTMEDVPPEIEEGNIGFMFVLELAED